MAASRSLSFAFSSARPSIRVSPSAKAASTARTGYSSIMLGARSGGTRTPFSRRVARADVGDRLAAFLALVLEGDIGAHFLQRDVEAGARRIDQHALDRDVGARHQQAAATRNAAELGSPGTTTSRPSSSAWPLTVMRAAPSRIVRDHLGAEVARASARCGRGSPPARSRWSRPAPAGRRAGSPTSPAPTAPAAGTRSAPASTTRETCSGSRSRSAGIDRDAHLLQRGQDATHRPARQRGVADHLDRHVVAGDARPSSAACRCRRCRNRAVRRAAAGRRRRAPAPPSRSRSFVAAAPSCADDACGVEHVLGLEQPGDAGAAGGERAEHQGAVRDRLVAGHPDAAGEGPEREAVRGRAGGGRHGCFRQLSAIAGRVSMLDGHQPRPHLDCQRR